jgi:tripartite-type tricarboxylate transporter receptor subunit TctC
MGRLQLCIGVASLLGILPATGARADDVADFYKTTTLRLIVAADAGDGYDSIGRVVARNLGRHIPGNPRIVVENMGGASGRLAANYAYTLAPKDGSALVELLQTTPLGQTLGENGVRYDAAKFNWIGTPLTPVDVFVVWSATGIKTMQDATHIVASIGATSATAQNYIYPQLANELLGAKFRIVTGYSGGNSINLAMERNEVQGRGAFPWVLLKATHQDWLRNNKLSLLAYMSLEPPPDLHGVPRLVDLAPNEQARAVLELMAATADVGRPLAMPPGAPHERVAAVRRAFDEMARDPAFVADAASIKEEVAPKTGAELEELVRRIVTVPPATIERFRAALAAKE